MIRRLAMITFLLLQGIIWTTLTAYAIAQDQPAIQNGQTIVRGGVIRLGDAVYALDNSTHAVVGITAVTLVNNCSLRLTTDWQSGERIMSAIVDEDETVSRLGVQAGISGGGQYANIYLYKDGHQICANDPIFGTVGNLWVQITGVLP